MVQAELYRCPPPARLKFPILVQMTGVRDEVPTEAEVNLAVQGMRMGRAGGLSVMRAEDLKGWRKDSKQEKETVERRW